MRIKVKGIKDTLEMIRKEADAEVEKQKKEKISPILRRLKQSTPIDTGEARNGWRITEKGIENDVPYISYLNQGSSTQAPAYFVERAVLSQPGIKPSGIIVTKK